MSELPVRVRVYGLVAALAVLVGVPIWGSTLLILRATEIAVFCVAFAGLHILSGHLGLISVGHGAFIGIGAVGAAHAIDDLALPYLLAPVAGALVGACFGALIGFPSLRLPGAYLALLTLAMAMVLPIAMRQIDGPLGYRIDGDLHPPRWTGLTLAEINVWQYLLVLVVGAAIVGLTHLIVRGRFTRSLIAARDEPTAAAAFGIDVSRVRLAGVVLSAALAGAAGGLSLYPTPLVAASHYPFSLSVAMFTLMLALGASRLWVVLPASAILVLLPLVLTELGRAAWQPIVYAVILLVMTRISKGEGLVSVLERRRHLPVVTLAPPRSLAVASGAAATRSGTGAGNDDNPWLLTPEPPSRGRAKAD